MPPERIGGCSTARRRVPAGRTTRARTRHVRRVIPALFPRIWPRAFALCQPGVVVMKQPSGHCCSECGLEGHKRPTCPTLEPCSTDEPSKTCITCGESKPLSAFYRIHRHSDERQRRCKSCDNAVRAYGVEAMRARGRPVTGTRKYCGLCYGLAHQRKRPRCPVCGGLYREEPPITLADVPERSWERVTPP
jgi:hypothetical protein